MTMQFRQFDSAAFLRDHWQRQPLLIRNPWKKWVNPLEPDELAGLACEGEVESRLIECAGDTLSLEHGPVPGDRFGQLGKAPWTLLVQAVDQHVPEVAALIEPFRFIPNWRIDDVMVSYAADGGGVGPHFDQYDVFLIQGLGRRRWRVGPVCDDSTRLLPHDGLRLLAGFEAEQEWVLEPGDILYLPPRFAHDGVAVGDDCMTYSIGFRAPSRSELIAAWCDDVLNGLTDDDRYCDPGLPAQANPGEITGEALGRLHAMITERLLDRDLFARAFGRHATTPRYPDMDWRPEEPLLPRQLVAASRAGAAMSRNPASRFSFIALSGKTILLFVDGQCYECDGEAASLARRICADDRVILPTGLAGKALELVRTLCNRGSLALDS